MGCCNAYPGEEGKAKRLDCFDGLARKEKANDEKERTQKADGRVGDVPVATESNSGVVSLKEHLLESHSAPARSLLAEWNLHKKGDPGFSTQPYRSTYLLFANRTNRRNQQPSSQASGHTVTQPFDWDQEEIKFQFSLKSELTYKDGLNLADFDKLRLWFGYTQQSNWQAYNFSKSSPFRENNYEPELILTLGRRQPEMRRGQDTSDVQERDTSSFKLVNIGFSHQSNGRSNPESRSWWRMYVQGGWEFRNAFSLLGRVWWRFREKSANDDNPDIRSYVGRGDIMAKWEPVENHIASLLYRNSLSLGSNRGFAQVDWSFPRLADGVMRPYLQYTSGYGESLIDYNFRQWTLGAGVSFELGK